MLGLSPSLCGVADLRDFIRITVMSEGQKDLGKMISVRARF